MNCKPGDLAVIVRVNANTKESLGRIVEVVHAEHPSTYILAFGINEELPRWLCRGVGGPLKTHSGQVFDAVVIPDFALRPIRDPGDDAQDETLQWLPVPTKELEKA